MATSNSLSAETLREAFDYDPLTGDLFWKVRPLHHFLSEAACKTFNSANAGAWAGTYAKGRYLRLNLAYRGKRYLMAAHRAILCMQEGVWPGALVDHIDGNPGNNRLANLRHASHQENNRNRGVAKHNQSGIKGVRARKCGTFGASLRIDGKLVWLGTFKTAEAASAAHDEAAARLFGAFAYQGASA